MTTAWATSQAATPKRRDPFAPPAAVRVQQKRILMTTLGKAAEPICAIELAAKCRIVGGNRDSKKRQKSID